MCLAVPAQILEVRSDGMGVADHAGVRREISLMLLDEVNVGDYVIIHAGFAIHKIDEAAAQEALEYLKLMAEDLPPDFDLQ